MLLHRAGIFCLPPFAPQTVGELTTGEGNCEFLREKTISCGLLKNDHK
jgi:hypothetical protein